MGDAEIQEPGVGGICGAPFPASSHGDLLSTLLGHARFRDIFATLAEALLRIDGRVYPVFLENLIA